MITIHKYRLEMTDTQHIDMPEDSVILGTACQFSELCIFARIDTSKPLKSRKFYVVGTGNPFPKSEGDVHVNFIGTALQFEGNIIWHVFQVSELVRQ